MKYAIIILFVAIAITLGTGIYLNQTEIDIKLGGILIGSSLTSYSLFTLQSFIHF